MNNSKTYYADPNMTADDLDRLRNQLEYENRRNGGGSQPAPVRAEWVGGVYETVVGRSDKDRVHRVQTAVASPGLRPGHVIVNGMETTVEAAQAAGYSVRVEGNGSGFKQPVERSPSTRGATAGHNPETASREGVEIAPDKPQGRAQTASDGTPQDDGIESAEGVQKARQEAASTASKTLADVERAHGPEAVDAGLSGVAESGYVPEDGELPPGVTADHVEKIVAGYVAQADDTLSAVGASVNMLMETLTDDELRAARMATLSGDASKMHHLGKFAVDRLSTLPARDPEAFAEMVEGMSPAERKALSQNAKGEWFVSVPGRAPMSFGLAVRQGIVRV